MQAATVHVIDDDPDVRSALAWLIESVQLKVCTYPGIADFLDTFDRGSEGCVVLDVRMPGMSGMEFLDRMERLGIDLPVIMLSGHGTIPMATRAMRGGAVDFIQKPINEQLLLDRIQEAISRRRMPAANVTAATKLEGLTSREREVALRVASGLHNKEIARELGLSPRTVETYRALAMKKLGANTLAEFVSVVLLISGERQDR
jgi:FixJ family two-component response regulator